MRESLHRAKNLRKKMTDAENRLWYYLRDRRFNGVKFKRQVPVGEFIVDFLCHDRKIVIELDGGQHNLESVQIYDERRMKFLSHNGYTVLRYWNNEIFCEIDSVLNDINCHL